MFIFHCSEQIEAYVCVKNLSCELHNPEIYKGQDDANQYVCGDGKDGKRHSSFN